MEIHVSLDGSENTEILVALRMALSGEEALRGRTSMVSAPPEPGTLGGGLTAIAVQLGPAAITAFTTVLVAWIRQRSGRVKLLVTNRDGLRIEVDAEKFQARDAATLHQMTAELAARMSRELEATPRELP
jgi:hypothetical protein